MTSLHSVSPGGRTRISASTAMSGNELEAKDETAMQENEQPYEHANAAPKRGLSEIEDPLDFEIRHLTRNLEELRKRRKLIELQEELLVEEQLIVAAQQRLQAAKEVGLRSCKEPTPVVVTPKAQERGGMTVLGSAQTPVKNHTVSPDAHQQRAQTAPDLDLNQIHNLAVRNISPVQQDSTSRPIQPNHAEGISSEVDPTSPVAAESEGASDPSEYGSESLDGSTNDGVDSSSIAQGQSSLPRSHPPPVPPTNQPPRRVSPISPRSQPSRRMSPVPPRPRIKLCEAETWWECRNFMGGLETQFSKFPTYYTRERQLEYAEQYISPEMRKRWAMHSSELPRVTWFDFCVFLANQLAPSIPGTNARRLYTKTYQKDSQSVTEYAVWLQQFAPHFRSADHNPMRHLYDRILPCIKRHMATRGKGWTGFRELTAFVEYLQSMEDAIPERIENLGHRKLFPRH